MKERLIILVRYVEIMHQAQQGCTIKTLEPGLDIYPRRLRFGLTSDHMLDSFSEAG